MSQPSNHLLIKINVLHNISAEKSTIRHMHVVYIAGKLIAQDSIFEIIEW